MSRWLVTVILLASSLVVAQTGSQNNDRRKAETQHLVAELHAKLSVINQTDPARCRVAGGMQ